MQGVKSRAQERSNFSMEQETGCGGRKMIPYAAGAELHGVI